MEPMAAALTLGATLRLTRLVVVDDLGDWWLKGPLTRAVLDLPLTPEGRERAGRYLEGLDCKWCVGYWIATGVLASETLTRGTRARPLWRFVTGSLTLNYLAATLAAVEDVGMIVADEADTTHSPGE